MSLLLNICLCLDLIMTMYSPFKPASSRVKWYLLVSLLTPVLLVMTIALAHSKPGSRDTCIDTYYNPDYTLYATARIQN